MEAMLRGVEGHTLANESSKEKREIVSTALHSLLSPLEKSPITVWKR